MSHLELAVLTDQERDTVFDERNILADCRVRDFAGDRVWLDDTRAAAEVTAADILGEVRDAALAQLSFRLARLEKAMVRANPRTLHDLRRRRDLVELALIAAQRI